MKRFAKRIITCIAIVVLTPLIIVIKVLDKVLDTCLSAGSNRTFSHHDNGSDSEISFLII